MRLKLHRLLELHDRNAVPGALLDYIGDGYLLERNRLASNVRTAVRGLGYRFSTTEPRGYFTWVGAALFTILETKTIPYRDTVSPLRRIERKAPGVVDAREVVGHLERSLVLHESLHCLAHGLLAEAVGERRRFLRGKMLAVFDGILGEAVANAGETYVHQYAHEPVHRFVLEAYHSQINPAEVARQDVQRLVDRFGEPFVFRTMILGYVLYNLVYTDVDARLADRIVAMAEPPSAPRRQDRERLHRLIRAALFLEHRARVYTAYNYFRYAGLSRWRNSTEYMIAMRAFDFCGALEHDPAYLAVIRGCAEVAVGSGAAARVAV